MPQIFVIFGTGTRTLLVEEDAQNLGKRLISVVEKEFSIEGMNDTAFTSVRAFSDRNEAAVQVEVRYTAGEDEYGRGEPFDLSEEEQRKLIQAIKEEFLAFLMSRRLPLYYNLSVLIKPRYKSVFETFSFE